MLFLSPTGGMFTRTARRLDGPREQRTRSVVSLVAVFYCVLTSCIPKTGAFSSVPSFTWRRTMATAERTVSTASTYFVSRPRGLARPIPVSREVWEAQQATVGWRPGEGTRRYDDGRSSNGQLATMTAMAASGANWGTAAGAGVGSKRQMNAMKAAVLAVYSVAVSVQPSILILATKAVMKLVASCGLGYWFSKKGVLDQAAITSLSKLIFFVFQPCLLFVNVASTVGNPSQKLSKLLVLPIFAILQILFGSAIGKIMEKLLRLTPESSEARELRMCTSFANSGPLPLLFVDSIFGGHPDATIVSSAVAFISFYLLGWSPMFWTAGYTMVAGKPQSAAPMSAADSKHFSKLSTLRKMVVAYQRLRASPTFKRIVNAPVMGCIAGMLVGLLPWGRSLMLGKDAPLAPILDALKGLGNAYLPSAILVLAGSLAKPAVMSASSSQSPPTTRAKNAFYRKVGAIMVSRFMIMPFVAAAMLMSGSRMGAIPYDKLIWFVLMMEGCMPSAQNSVVILQMENKPELAASMAKTLTAVYLLSAVPMAFLLSGILHFVQL